MLREFLQIFRSEDNLHEMSAKFTEMLEISCRMTLDAGDLFFRTSGNGEKQAAVYERDRRVNKLQRKIRKRVVAHLSIRGNHGDVPHCLYLMSLVKDVERIGDYAKNISEIKDFSPDPLPDDEYTHELKEIRAATESIFQEVPLVLDSGDHSQAADLIKLGGEMAKRCDRLVQRIAQSGHTCGPTTALVLGTRFYKRICGHLLNVLSSIVMPLHKLDYFDEDVLEPEPASTEETS